MINFIEEEKDNLNKNMARHISKMYFKWKSINGRKIVNMFLEVENLKKNYGNGENMTSALEGVSFSIEKSEFVSIMGASGSGKTTLLNCISTVDQPSMGTVSLDGKRITALSEEEISIFRRDSLGFVFQDFRLLDALTIEENIALPLTIKNVNPNVINQRIKELSSFLEIIDIIKKFPYQVSGGQKQRVAIARAIVTNPKILLADEPTGALDSNTSRKIMELLCRINETMKMTILMVTHDATAASYSNKILMLKDGKINKIISNRWDKRIDFYHKILDVLASEVK